MSKKQQPRTSSQPRSQSNPLTEDPSFDTCLAEARAIAHLLIRQTGPDPVQWESFPFHELIGAEVMQGLVREPAESEAALFEVKLHAHLGYLVGFAVGRMAGRLSRRQS